MDLLLSSLGGLAMIAASLAVGCAVAFALRALGRGLHHPELGSALAILLVPLAFVVPARGAPGMTIIFALISALLFWVTANHSRAA